MKLMTKIYSKIGSKPIKLKIKITSFLEPDSDSSNTNHNTLSQTCYLYNYDSNEELGSFRFEYCMGEYKITSISCSNLVTQESFATFILELSLKMSVGKKLILDPGPFEQIYQEYGFKALIKKEGAIFPTSMVLSDSLLKKALEKFSVDIQQQQSLTGVFSITEDSTLVKLDESLDKFTFPINFTFQPSFNEESMVDQSQMKVDNTSTVESNTKENSQERKMSCSS